MASGRQKSYKDLVRQHNRIYDRITSSKSISEGQRTSRLSKIWNATQEYRRNIERHLNKDMYQMYNPEKFSKAGYTQVPQSVYMGDRLKRATAKAVQGSKGNSPT